MSSATQMPDYWALEFLQLNDMALGFRDRFEKAEAENAKLRELVRFANKTVEGLCELVENSPGCSMCPLNQDEDRACGAAELFSRMRELGVDA